MAGLSPEAMRRLLDAVMDVGAGADLNETLHKVVEAASDLAGARFGALGVLDPSGTRLEDFLTVGIDDERRSVIGRLPEGHGILGLVIEGDEPLRLDDLGGHEATVGFPAGHPRMRSFLGVPIRVRGTTFGNLYLTEKGEGGSFTDEDEELIVGLAAAAGVAIDNARLHERNARLALAADRERIGRELHDTVIQRLFATGLSLQATRALCESAEPAVLGRIEDAIEQLDLTVSHIRSVIFGLESTERNRGGLRERVLAVCESGHDSLGLRPRVAFNGPVDSLAGAAIQHELVATLREALSNVARHARASAVDIVVSATPTAVELTVRDDGVGGAIPTPEGRGLRNMAARAKDLGGTCSVDAAHDGGTAVVWRVPLAPD